MNLGTNQGWCTMLQLFPVSLIDSCPVVEDQTQVWQLQAATGKCHGWLHFLGDFAENCCICHGLNRLEEGGWPKNPLLALRVYLQIAEIDKSSSEIRMWCIIFQQMMVEMQQMASRPFATVCVEVDRKTESASGGGIPERKELRDHVDSALRRRKKVCTCVWEEALLIWPVA